VYDACNREKDAKTDLVVPLGASPNAKVSDLALSVTFAPKTECALPTNQTAQAFVAVTASAASAGASVTIATSSGTFAGGATSLQLKLQPASGISASPGTYFIPGPAGTALISAYAEGATPVLRSVPIVAPPTVAAPVVSLRRDIEYPATVETAGNLQNCIVEKVSPSSSVVKITDPEALAGEIRGDASVKEAALSCSEREQLALSVSFTKDAPDDAAVTLRCFDTFGQQGSLTFKVAPPPATESSSSQ
jgi:hypothetical protein